MRFTRRHRPELELRTRSEAYLGSADPNGAALPPTPYLIAEPPTMTPAAVGSGLPAALPELRARYRQSKDLRPAPNRTARSLVIGAAAPNAIHSPYDRLRTQIIKRLRENGWRTLAVTSPTNASGNTLTAVNLAISMARDSGYNVLLVELNLINPSFCQLLGLKQQQGIVEHLLHDVPVPELVLNPGIDRLSVIPGGTPVTNSSELLASPKMARLVEELKLRFKHAIIVFDLPSVLAVDDAVAFSPLADCVLLVVEEGETSVNAVRRAADDLGSSRLLGVVLNRSIYVENDRKGLFR